MSIWLKLYEEKEEEEDQRLGRHTGYSVRSRIEPKGYKKHNKRLSAKPVFPSFFSSSSSHYLFSSPFRRTILSTGRHYNSRLVVTTFEYEMISSFNLDGDDWKKKKRLVSVFLFPCCEHFGGDGSRPMLCEIFIQIWSCFVFWFGNYWAIKQQAEVGLLSLALTSWSKQKREKISFKWRLTSSRPTFRVWHGGALFKIGTRAVFLVSTWNCF